MRTQSTRIRRLQLAAIALAFGAVPASGDEHLFALSNQTYRSECGACHVAYPPQLLPKESWRAIMKQLDKHFGVDASVDARTQGEIRSWLEKNAGSKRRSDAVDPLLRVTRSAWFRDEHNEVPAAVWRSAAVKTPSNCGACHTHAETGDFSERTLRVPR